MGKFRQGHNAASKLTPTQVYELREKYAQGTTQGELAREYKMSIGQIGRIVRGECWQQYDNPAQARAQPERDEVAQAEARLVASLNQDSTSLAGKVQPASELPLEREQAAVDKFNSYLNSKESQK